MSDNPQLPELPSSVRARLSEELGERAERVLSCVQTAEVFIRLGRADSDPPSARFGASAAYNLREGLEAIVDGHPAPSGGLGDVVEAWKRYELAVSDPAVDHDAALRDLHGVLAGLERDDDRQAFKT